MDYLHGLPSSVVPGVRLNESCDATSIFALPSRGRSHPMIPRLLLHGFYTSLHDKSIRAHIKLGKNGDLPLLKNHFRKCVKLSSRQRIVAQSVELTMKGLFSPLYVPETEANDLFSAISDRKLLLSSGNSDVQ